ncbi:hypothetical protein ETD86_29520 [Nonomuraea turkmeniaca]|uniref:Uncharacterized protein n=1 Tax=Nonomuraea turkmeniaca TaxID=103838 RepID=A0A5S4FA60_9ACTN|nr:hypothetical protein [Nonomuraea turkmeniaca]TMR14087.1 hypothetical protein ETD86_29520 [Nonomuraea turkmeniaca]
MSASGDWAPLEIEDLLHALGEAGLHDVSWAGQMGVDVVEVSGHAWARRRDEEVGAAAARRGLHELAERAIAIVEQRGFHHARPPQIIIDHTTKSGMFTGRGGYELMLRLRLWPPRGETIATPVGGIRIVESTRLSEGTALLVAFGGIPAHAAGRAIEHGGEYLPHNLP